MKGTAKDAAHDITWLDFKREPQCAPDPAYPNGKRITLPSPFAAPFCTVELPYPAKRCGMYLVHCLVCQLRTAITTAGRPDDPLSVQLPCGKKRGAPTA